MPEERKISLIWLIPVGIILGVGGGLALALAVSRAVAPCLELNPDKFYYFIYTGPSQTFIEALGECGGPDIIWTIDVYDPETNDYWPPADPEHDILETGSKCRVMVQETCTLCGFELIT